MIDSETFRREVLSWYWQHKRDLPWRSSTDPYRVWISEIMLQQTRVTAVIPYYERFLERFPDVESLAAAREQDLLTAWAGLGYYSRARNLHRAAQAIVAGAGFPTDYDSIRALSGVGDYTSAAVASIAFRLPHAAVDGNVIRVLSRISAEPGEVSSPLVRQTLRLIADALLDPRHPGDFNQAMMELGATVCLPSLPKCLICPVAAHCEARRQGRQQEFPIKRTKPPIANVEERLLLIRKSGSYLLWQRPADSSRMAGFWELPRLEQLPSAKLGKVVSQFRHTIVNTKYRFELVEASVRRTRAGFVWHPRVRFAQLPISTVTRKALARVSE